MSKDLAIADLATMGDGDPVVVTGELRRLQIKRTVLGELWATMILAQGPETVKALVFVHAFATVDKNAWAPGTRVKVTGRVSRTSDGAPKVATASVERA